MVTAHYSHTQRGTLILVIMLVLSATLAILGCLLTPLALISVPVLLAAGWLFKSLTIQVDQDRLRWQFGSGIIRKSVRTQEIASARSVRTNILEGWGIHLSRFGWLYNVSGYDAVAITLTSGKRFALGTDQPGELVRAINDALGVD